MEMKKAFSWRSRWFERKLRAEQVLDNARISRRLRWRAMVMRSSGGRLVKSNRRGRPESACGKTKGGGVGANVI